MPKTRTIADLTAADIRQVLTDIFQPVRIANIQYHRREACWSATLTTEWAGEEDGKTTTTHMRDEVKMYDPWQYETRSIDPDGIPPGRKDLLLWKQFCFSRGLCSYWHDNPYLTEECRKQIVSDILQGRGEED